MSQSIRSQEKCYYASGEYARSFWGKSIWLYQGWGELRLTTEGLTLFTRTGVVDIPFKAIKSISLGRFSYFSKPFGLSRLTICYFGDDGDFQSDDLRTIDLIPFESALAPTWTTSRLVESWYETLQQVEELNDRFEPPTEEPATVRSAAQAALVFAAVAVPFVVFVGLSWVLTHVR